MDLQIPTWPRIAAGLAGIFYYAASAMPLIVALGLIVGRRGNGRFCLWGTARLLSLATWLCVAVPVFIILSYLSVVLPFPERHIFIWAPLLENAGMPYTTSLIAWAAGGALLVLAQGAIAPILFNFNAPDDRYTAKHVRSPLFLCLAAAFAFFLTFILLHWPFGGLPEGMPWDRAAMAVFRNACRHYFMAFCPAGSIALLFALHVFSNSSPADERQKISSLRWCAVWAIAGYLPYLLQNWGIAIGVGLRQNLPPGMAGAMGIQYFALACLTLAVCCWVWAFISPRRQKTAAWLGFGMLILKEFSPLLAKIAG